MTRGRVKYPRTFHHPSSPGVQSDDKIAKDLSVLEGQEVVITEKMDGENTTLYCDGFHARSLDSGAHPARSWLAGLHGQIAHRIPKGWRICGENLYARHAIAYDALPSYFAAFSIWTAEHTCLSWKDTLHHLDRLGLTAVPVLAQGQYSSTLIETTAKRIDPKTQEGFVIRLAGSFDAAAFSASVLKWIRPNHVQTTERWRHAPLTPNALATP